MDELREIARKVDEIAGIVDYVSIRLEEDYDVDGAIDKLADVTMDCGVIAGKLRDIAGES